MLNQEDKEWINKVVEEDKKMADEEKGYSKYTLSYINGQPGLVIRANHTKELDEALVAAMPLFKRLKDAIDNDREKTQSEPNAPKGELIMVCSIHNIEMAEATSKKTGNAYWYHRDNQGTMCFGDGWKPKTK